MALTKDGDIIAGGFTITLDTAAITLTVNTGNITRPGNTVVRTDVNDEPAAAAHWKGYATGTLQIETKIVAEQADFTHDTFTTVEIEGASQKYIITGGGVSRGKGSTLSVGDLQIAHFLN